MMMTVALSLASCRQPAINVGVVFATSWRLSTEPLSDTDNRRIKRKVLETLQHAYAGFDVRFTETSSGSRLIRVEDTPQESGSGRVVSAAAAGITYPFGPVSSVRVDVLWNAELAAVQCQDIFHCRKTRTELLDGLGRGIGATAAHELGHQIRLRFTTDMDCDDCYDGDTSTSYTHFFANKHWSDRSMHVMRTVLPPR